MKIIVRIRPREGKKLVMEVDYQLEKEHDTPLVHAHGLRLVRALVGDGAEEVKDDWESGLNNYRRRLLSR